MIRTATFSPCRRYRYELTRSWEPVRGIAAFVCLNPSTADETVDDPTIRRCIAYAKDWGFGAMCMVNLFAFRATFPAQLRSPADPIGPENDEYLAAIAVRSSIVVAGWGTNGSFMNRADQVRALLGDKLHCLRLTREGHPGHPLYLPKSLKPVEFTRA